jgi:hypothetical protein
VTSVSILFNDDPEEYVEESLDRGDGQENRYRHLLNKVWLPNGLPRPLN